MQVLITDEVHEALTKGLEEKGFEVLSFTGSGKSELLPMLSTIEGLVVRTKLQIDKEIIDAAPRLKFIARAGAGMDNVDEAYAVTRGIACFNAGEANADAVGEHAAGMLLMLMNNLLRADRQVRNKTWLREENRGIEIKGKCVGIVGYGNTGKAFARKMSGFEARVIAYDKYLVNYGDRFAEACRMEQIFSAADIISFHIPLTVETRHLVNSDYLEQFRKPLYLLNLSRGPVVKTEDLVEALRSGKLKGCALDVLENEKLETMSEHEQAQFDYLVNSDRVVLSPHIGGWSTESYQKISTVLLAKILELNN
jgi:D-3-phosphoglycerate dehydrogenase